MSIKRAPREMRVAGGVLLTMIVALAVVINQVPIVERLLTGSGLSVCLMKNTTGIPCMGCRGTRAALAFAHGELDRSFAFNPLLAGVAVSLTAWAGMVSLAGRYIAVSVQGPARRLVAIAVIFLIIGNWIYVIAAGG